MVSHLPEGAGNPHSLAVEPWLESQNNFAGHSTPWRTEHCTNASSHPGGPCPSSDGPERNRRVCNIKPSSWTNAVVFRPQTSAFSVRKGSLPTFLKGG